MSIKKNEQQTYRGQTFTRGNGGMVKVTENGKSIKHVSVTRANLALNQNKRV